VRTSSVLLKSINKMDPPILQRKRERRLPCKRLSNLAVEPFRDQRVECFLSFQ
jgi:hypothetical protein